MKYESRWIKDVPLKKTYTSLDKDLKADVAIIGAGIAGLSAAYYLIKAGKKIVLLEKDSIASGETGNTTAFLTMGYDFYIQDLAKKYGKDLAKKTWEVGQDMIDEIERLVNEMKISCDFIRCPAYVYATDSKGFDFLKKEYKLGVEFGFNFELNADASILPFRNHGYLKILNQAKFHPRKFLYAIAEKITQLGGQIFEESQVTEINGGDNVCVKTSNGTVSAKHVIICTNTANHDNFEIITRTVPYQSYVLDIKVRKGILEEALYWDTQDPYQYFRVDRTSDFDRIILGGMDHETGKEMDHDHYKDLENYFTKIFPSMEYKIDGRWAGQVIETVDELPFMGKLMTNKRRLVASGFAGNGMTFGWLSGRVNADVILGKENEYEKMYTTRRFRAFLKIIHRGINYIFYLLKDRLKKRGKNFNNLKNDSGKVIKINGENLAIYKDGKGEIHKMSALCTHMKCVVGWNNLEKTWDCPCHGSRFKKTGEVLDGPARIPLIKIGKN